MFGPDMYVFGGYVEADATLVVGVCLVLSMPVVSECEPRETLCWVKGTS